VYLIVVFIVWLYQNLGSYIETLSNDDSARMTFLFILFLSGFFITLIAQAVRRWKRQAGEER
jgi:hypothetical protein